LPLCLPLSSTSYHGSGDSFFRFTKDIGSHTARGIWGSFDLYMAEAWGFFVPRLIVDGTGEVAGGISSEVFAGALGSVMEDDVIFLDAFVGVIDDHDGKVLAAVSAVEADHVVRSFLLS
jgi:hypothetical protein